MLCAVDGRKWTILQHYCARQDASDSDSDYECVHRHVFTPGGREPCRIIGMMHMMLALDRHASKRSQVSRLLEVAGGADAGIMERKSTALLHHGHELVAR